MLLPTRPILLRDRTVALSSLCSGLVASYRPVAWRLIFSEYSYSFNNWIGILLGPQPLFGTVRGVTPRLFDFCPVSPVPRHL